MIRRVSRPGPGTPRRQPWRLAGQALAVFIAAVVVAACGLAVSAETREERGRRLAEGIAVAVTVDASSLVATKAFADFGLEEGVRLVLVRILDKIRLSVRFEAAQDVTLAATPRLCMVGPAWAPDDAGLSDRCWGEPDLTSVVAGEFSPDAEGRVALRAGEPVIVETTIARGDERCDYRPGTWQLEIALQQVIDGQAVGPFETSPADFEVPLEPEGTALAFVPLGDSRYCGLAATVWREQGEPALLP